MYPHIHTHIYIYIYIYICMYVYIYIYIYIYNPSIGLKKTQIKKICCRPWNPKLPKPYKYLVFGEVKSPGLTIPYVSASVGPESLTFARFRQFRSQKNRNRQEPWPHKVFVNIYCLNICVLLMMRDDPWALKNQIKKTSD